MTARNKRIAKDIAKTGVGAISDIAILALRAMATVALILVTAGAVFACIFLIYVRTNLTTGLEVNPETFDMNLSSVIYYVDPVTGRQRELVTLQSTEFRIWVNFDEIPQHVVDAVVAIEDHRFFRHRGVDWSRTAGAFLNMFLGMRDTFGGSTITQQLIKNLTREDDATVQRKLAEIFRALEFEENFSKEEILEFYLNLIYFGHGAYGIGAAAYYYFGKDVRDLTVAEAASIISITNNPSRFSPYANLSAHMERQQTVLRRMFELGYFSSYEEFRQAADQELNFQRGDITIVEEVIYTWYEETIIRDVTRALMDEFGYSDAQARRRLFTGGLRIIASIDMELQAIVDYFYMNPELLPVVTGSTQPLQSSIIIADPYTGEILALSGGVGRKSRNMLLNRATMSRRPPGSAIKPISVYAPAMELGYVTPDRMFNDSPTATLQGTNWMPRNANRTHSGWVDARHAHRWSINTIPAMIIDEIGPSESFRFMRDILGFTLDVYDEDYAPLALGQLTHGATVREMTSAFTMFPNDGWRVELRSFTRIYDNNGNILIDNRPRYTRAISESTAFWMTDMLIDAVIRGTGTEANIPGFQTAGKTGTSTDSQDRWFIGFTPYFVAGVWTGFDTPARMSSAGNPAAQIFRMVMEKAHEGLEPRDFPRPDNIALIPVEGVQAQDVSTQSVDVFGNVLRQERGRYVVGTEVSRSAPSIQGYTLLSAEHVTITVSANPARNVIQFIFSEDAPEPEEDPHEPYPGDPADLDDPYDFQQHPPGVAEPPAPPPAEPPALPPEEETLEPGEVTEPG